MSRLLPRPFLACQAMIAIGLIGLLTLVPPSHGAMLLIDPAGQIATPIRLALSHHARLLATGPLPGSIVVVGTRSALAPAARSAGLLLLAAPFAGCGKAGEALA